MMRSSLRVNNSLHGKASSGHAYLHEKAISRCPPSTVYHAPHLKNTPPLRVAAQRGRFLGNISQFSQLGLNVANLPTVRHRETRKRAQWAGAVHLPLCKLSWNEHLIIAINMLYDVCLSPDVPGALDSSVPSVSHIHIYSSF